MSFHEQQGAIVAENVRAVSIGEMIVSDAPDDVLVAYGLGSCVAICLYDPVIRVGAMLHALLPAVHNRADGSNPAKFVEQGVPLMIKSILKFGTMPSQLIVGVCGGSQMLSAPGFSDSLDIGKRNVLATEIALQTAGLQIHAQDTGGHAGRTVRFYITDGQVVVKTLGQGERILIG